MLKVTRDKVIIDGHEPTREQCETMTLLANALAESKDFKTLELKNGYGEFEKVGKTEELKFVPDKDMRIINFDSHISKVVFNDVEWTVSGETKSVSMTGFDGVNVATLTLADGYILDNVTFGGIFEDCNLSTKTDTSFSFPCSFAGFGTITLTSKKSGGGGSVSETWVLNNTLAVITQTFNINFTANGVSYTKMVFDNTSDFYVYYGITGVYNDLGGNGWYDQADRTVTFETAPSGDLLTYLQANAVKQTVERVTCDLATAFADKWAALGAGEHTVQIRAKNPGNYLDSDLSAAVKVLKIINYPITVNATNCTGASSNPTVVPSNTTGTVLKFTANTGYDLPTSVTVSGATSSWNRSTGELTLTKPTGNVTVTIAGTVQTYGISITATNATPVAGNPTTITYGGSATLKFTFPDGYYAPTAVTVTGATSSWNASTGTLTLTNATSNVTGTVAGTTKTFNITYSLTNVNSASGNPTTILSNASNVKVTLTKKTGYTLPSNVTVTGVASGNWSYVASTGVLTISKPTGNVTIMAAGTAEVYNITTTTESATADPSNPKTITYGSTATLKFTFPTGYESPDDDNVAVTGATKQWTQSTGTLVLSNPTGNVTVKVVGVEAVAQLSGLWKWNDTIPDADWAEQAVEFTLQDGTAYKKMYWDGDGTTYDLYYDDELEGGSATKVYSYNGDEQTGTWVDAKYRIVNFGAMVQVTQIFYTYVNTNATQLTQLPPPQNVTADGTVVSWDEVENATEYEVYADGASIGTVKNGETWVLNETPTYPSSSIEETINFKSNGKDYISILISARQPNNVFGISYYYGATSYDAVYPPQKPQGWLDNAYRTITFETAPTGDLLAWLQANGVKQ